MKIKELIEKLDTLEETERVKLLRIFFTKITPISVQTLKHFQEEFFNTTPDNTPFEVFIKKQNEKIKECYNLELSEMGIIVRKQFDMKPLDIEEII